MKVNGFPGKRIITGKSIIKMGGFPCEMLVYDSSMYALRTFFKEITFL